MYKKLKLKIHKLIQPNFFKPLNVTERIAIMILLRLVKDKNVELMLHPEIPKCYIHAKQHNVLIIYTAINSFQSSVTLINHKYNYTIVLNERASKHFSNIFNDAVKTRREILEKQYLNNTENSLRVFLNNLLENETILASKSK